MGESAPVLSGIIATVFFVTILISALTSAVSLMEVGVAYLIEEMKMKRKWATLTTFIGTWTLGCFCSLSSTSTRCGVDMASVSTDEDFVKALLGLFGKKPKIVLLGFLIVISLFSMFMSNTATAAMMLAFLAPVLKSLPENETGKVGLALFPFGSDMFLSPYLIYGP